MKKIFYTIFALFLLFIVPLSVSAASTVSTDFEDAAVPLSVNGYKGWYVHNTSLDQAIVANTYGFSKFGEKVWHVSSKGTDSSFANSPYSFSTPDEAGETAAVNNGLSGGTRQNHFEASFDFASTRSTPGKTAVQVSPDRGNGSRMGVLEFDDGASSDGTEVWYQSFTTGFGWTKIATLPRGVVYNMKIVVDFVDGPNNDVVKIYQDDVLIHTSSTWENYYASVPQSTVTVDSLFFRPVLYYGPEADNGQGLLFDNVVLYSGPAHTPETEITEEDTELDIEEGSQAIDIVVPDTVVNPSINFSSVQNGLVAETPVEIKTVAQTAKGAIGVIIPSGTQITGSAGWNGVVHLPKVSSATVTPSVGANQTATVALAIEVGSPSHSLSFNTPVRVVLIGHAGKQVGYSNDNGASFTEITAACVANALPVGKNECKMVEGSDLVVLTNHFTIFAAYSVTTNASTSTSRVIGGRVATLPAAQSTTTPVPSLPSTSPTVVIPGQYTFTTLMKVGVKNADVQELQKLLTAKNFGTLLADGHFGPKTAFALKAFQKSNGLTADGVAGPMTRAILNK